MNTGTGIAIAGVSGAVALAIGKLLQLGFWALFLLILVVMIIAFVLGAAG
jgi:hypothetical protein